MVPPETVDGESPWNRKSRFFREADEYPGLLERYVSPKLVTTIRLFYNVIATRGLTSGADIGVGGHFGAFEWEDGTVTRIQFLLPIRPPRVDMAAKEEKAWRADARKDLLLAREVDEVVSDYFRYFVSETRPRNPKIGEGNKAGAAQKSKKAEERQGDPSSSALADLVILLAE